MVRSHECHSLKTIAQTAEKILIPDLQDKPWYFDVLIDEEQKTGSQNSDKPCHK